MLRKVKDVFRIVLDVRVPVREMALSRGGDVIDVIHAIEYRTDNAVSMFGGRPANHIKVINVRGDNVQPLSEDLIFVDISINQFDGDEYICIWF